MAKANRSIRQIARSLLSRLAARGSYAEPIGAAAGGKGEFAIVSPATGMAQPTVTASEAAVAWALSRGWLAREKNSNRYRIAPAGVEALRKTKCTPSTRVATPRSKPANKAQTAGTRTRQEGSLAWLRRRRDKDGLPLISEPQFAAGERLSSDYWHAQLMPRVTINWSTAAAPRSTRRAAPGAGVELSDAAVAARQRVNRALSAVGPELAGILVDVCCHDIGLEAAGRTQGWPQRAAKVVLQLALTGLARHYGLLAPEPRAAAHRLRHWGVDDYRPNLDAWRG